ncbi:hypothetical protein Pmani_000704 [Petrolisthes manimaculis]|uniref:Ionotropic glutamate receptor L-glutamate and glycine-binding domain-containing protein n=1 Tax=Petrolisthes manimaculis TaxID=1843537 RepID=A0AAE1USD9_9EUCA|nr:hypothetical protein Pmani_000704 [Petrolisthes manimaculis]
MRCDARKFILVQLSHVLLVLVLVLVLHSFIIVMGQGSIRSLTMDEENGAEIQQVSLLLRHTVVLYSNESEAVEGGAGDGNGGWAREVAEDMLGRGRDGWTGLQLWELETFLSVRPAVHVFTRPHQDSRGSYCVAFVILAPLDRVARALTPIQRGVWFVGSNKYLLVYPGHSNNVLVTPASLSSHPLLAESYNVVVVTRVPALNATKQRYQQNREGLDYYHLLRVCPYCANGTPTIQTASVWSPQTGFLVPHQPLYPDLFKVEIDSCYDKSEDGTITPSGHCVDNNMLASLANTLNFTYVFLEPEDGQWGHRLENGSYTGVIGTVERLEADFSLNIAITQDREEVVDCTVGYHVEPITFTTSKPRLLNQALALIRPFSPGVWAAFVSLLLLAGPVYYALSHLSNITEPHVSTTTTTTTTTTPTPSPPPSLTKACLLVFGAGFNQDVRWEPRPCPRLFAGGYVLGMYVVLSMYVAMLTASLTLPTLSPTPNTLTQLVHSDFSWGIEDIGAADYQLLKTSKVPLYQQVYRGLQPCPSLDLCITKARDTKFAFITWRTYLEDRIAVRFTSAGGERQLHVATGDIFPVELGWALTPGCPYTHAFNAAIRTMIEAGLISKWLRDLINDPKRRVEGQEGENGDVENTTVGGIQALGLDHLQSRVPVYPWTWCHYQCHPVPTQPRFTLHCPPTPLLHPALPTHILSSLISSLDTLCS